MLNYIEIRERFQTSHASTNLININDNEIEFNIDWSFEAPDYANFFSLQSIRKKIIQYLTF